jgi:fatty acid desaturase
MYCWDLGVLSSFEWRVTHALSHHLYTNTIIDFELSALEPFLDYRVYQPKSFWYRSQLAFPFLLMISPIVLFPEVIKRVISIMNGQQKFRPENLLPFSQLLLLVLTVPSTASSGWWMAFTLWLTMQSACNFCFMVIGLTTAHHHKDMYHVGDGQFRYGLDWGLAQLDATGDSKDVSGWMLTELSMFGNHVLHHLFPTLDHGLLDLLRPVLIDTCNEFMLPESLSWSPSIYNHKELIIGTLQQLARTQPRKMG